MKGFNDIEGTEICVGDEILFTAIPWFNSSSDLGRGTVIRFTPKNIRIEKITKGSVYNDTALISIEGAKRRVLVLKGEFKTYTKTEIERHDE